MLVFLSLRFVCICVSFSPILKGVVRLNDYKRTNTHDP